MNKDLERDISYLKASVDELESFLLSEDTLRQLPDMTFTVGGILLAHQRVSAANLEKETEKAWGELETIHNHWKVAWTKKCHAELKMRLRQWGDFILGMSSDKYEDSTAYKHQVRSRTIIQLLETSVPSVAESYLESINRKDAILRKFTVENDFVWEDAVKSGFPEDKFWYLYQTMKYEKSLE